MSRPSSRMRQAPVSCIFFRDVQATRISSQGARKPKVSETSVWSLGPSLVVKPDSEASLSSPVALVIYNSVLWALEIGAAVAQETVSEPWTAETLIALCAYQSIC
jgi:hypothetical protein